MLVALTLVASVQEPLVNVEAWAVLATASPAMDLRNHLSLLQYWNVQRQWKGLEKLEKLAMVLARGSERLARGCERLGMLEIDLSHAFWVFAFRSLQ